MVLEVTDENIAEVLGSDKVVVLDFWAEWCGPCRVYGPMVDEFASEHEDVLVGKVNVDNVPGVSAKYGIRNIPTTIIFKNGEVDNRLAGIQHKDKLAEAAGV